MSYKNTEKKKVNMLCPPPALLLALIIASGIMHRCFFGPFSYSPARWLIGIVIILASLLIIILSGRLFIKLKTPYRPTSPSTVLVQSGCYQISRNPMYVAMFGLLIGSGIILGSFVFIIASVLFLLIIHFGVVLNEEHYLETLYGPEYRQYKLKVRRWL